ncbi:hypothetical protein HELRODRAFT_177428 [Helobdella robusta]|uniref:Apple domain-containing protein n=1 Tax=Helobdella robusta TaxID=6412 RepID=T1FBP2_HELRO|nr:hypothetical protein HELRODRAFT_177428 [Helobdella robusta]ESN98182.1 hypothetical protein HELRODRAFT_177428 [Helobdella robusta]
MAKRYNNYSSMEPVVYSLKNVLLHKPTTQSSAYYMSGRHYDGSLAVDGDRSSDFSLNHCFHTADDEILKDFWMMVDMIIPYKIEYVVLWTRSGPTYTPRMDYFIIGLTNVNYFNLSVNQTIRGKYPLCGQYPYNSQESFGHRVNCSANVPAYRYVIAQQSPTAALGFCICELEAFVIKYPENIWKHREGMRLNGLSLHTMKGRSAHQCIIACIHFAGCTSVNFDRNLRMCDLNSGTVENVTNIVADQSFDYWQYV